jgi:hypothetical protein
MQVLAETFRNKANVGYSYAKGVADALEWVLGKRQAYPGQVAHGIGEVCDDVNHHFARYGYGEYEESCYNGELELDERIKAGFDEGRLFRAGAQFTITNPRENDPEADAASSHEFRVIEIFEPRLPPEGKP